MTEHRVSVAGHGQVWCACGERFAPSSLRSMEDAIEEYSKHYALEEQAKKPRARRGGVDESEPTSKSHLLTLGMLDAAWQTAAAIYWGQGDGDKYTPQRIRTCLAGLVRAGLAEERKKGRHREYRAARRENTETGGKA